MKNFQIGSSIPIKKFIDNYKLLIEYGYQSTNKYPSLIEISTLFLFK